MVNIRKELQKTQFVLNDSYKINEYEITRVKATNLLDSVQSGVLGNIPCHSSLSPVRKSPNLRHSVPL